MLTSAQEREIKAILASGQKIVAIKRYREVTGVGLQEAMYAVERWEGPASSAALHSLHTKAPSTDTKLVRQAEADAMQFVRLGNGIEAIRRYRAATQASLAEAKRVIDSLQVVHRSGDRIDVRLARTLIDHVAARREQEAVSQLMASKGYDEAEARAFVVTLRQKSCAGGCLQAIVVLTLLIVATGVAVYLFAGK